MRMDRQSQLSLCVKNKPVASRVGAYAAGIRDRQASVGALTQLLCACGARKAAWKRGDAEEGGSGRAAPADKNSMGKGTRRGPRPFV